MVLEVGTFGSSYASWRGLFIGGFVWPGIIQAIYSKNSAISFVHADDFVGIFRVMWLLLQSREESLMPYSNLNVRQDHQFQRKRERGREKRDWFFGWNNQTQIPFFSLSLLQTCSVLYCGKMGLENGNVLIDSGHARLHELGYKQELKRDLS